MFSVFLRFFLCENHFFSRLSLRIFVLSILVRAQLFVFFFSNFFFTHLKKENKSLMCVVKDSLFLFSGWDSKSRSCCYSTVYFGVNERTRRQRKYRKSYPRFRQQRKRRRFPFPRSLFFFLFCRWDNFNC